MISTEIMAMTTKRKMVVASFCSTGSAKLIFLTVLSAEDKGRHFP